MREQCWRICQSNAGGCPPAMPSECLVRERVRERELINEIVSIYRARGFGVSWIMEGMTG